MNTLKLQLSPTQRSVLFLVFMAAIAGAAVYWYHATNKRAIVKIKYQGVEGRAILSKKDLQRLKDNFQELKEKHLFYLHLIQYTTAVNGVRSKLKTEIDGFEQKLEAVVEVSKSIWKKHSEGDTVKIKYLPEDPQHFLLVLN